MLTITAPRKPIPIENKREKVLKIEKVTRPAIENKKDESKKDDVKQDEMPEKMTQRQ